LIFYQLLLYLYLSFLYLNIYNKSIKNIFYILKLYRTIMLNSKNKLLKNLIELFNKTENLNLTSEDIQKIIKWQLNKYKDFIVKALLSFDLSTYVSDSYDSKIEDNISGFLIIGNRKKATIIWINKKYSSFEELKDDIFQKYKNSWINDIDYLIIQIESKEKNMFKSVVQIIYYNFSYEKWIDKDDYLEKIIKETLKGKEKEIKTYLGANPLEVLEKIFPWKNLYFITLVDLFLSFQLCVDIKIKGFRRPPKKKITWNGNSIYYLVDTISLKNYIEWIYNAVKNDLNGEVDKLLEKNIRTYIRFKDNEPAKAIARTLFHFTENKNFFLYNNWIITVASTYTDKYDGDTDKYILKFKDFNIINWWQTTITLYKIYELIKDKSKFNYENEILSYIFSFYFEWKKSEINELVKNKNIEELRKKMLDYFVFIKEFLFGPWNENEENEKEQKLNDKEKVIIDKVLNKIKHENIKWKGNMPYFDVFIKDIINKIFVKEFLNLYWNKLKEELENRFEKNDILFKIFIWLNNELLNKVAKYVNLQNKVNTKDLISSKPEVKLLYEYINKFYKFNLYDNTDTTKNFDLFNQSVFVYLSTIETNKWWFLGDTKFWPSYAKEKKWQLFSQDDIYNKIWWFDIKNNEIEKRIFFYLIESKILYKQEKILLKELDLKNVNYIKWCDDLHILYVLAFLLKDNLNNIDFIKLIKELNKVKKLKDSNDILKIEIINNKSIWNYLKESIEIIWKILKENDLINEAINKKLYKIPELDKKIAKYFWYSGYKIKKEEIYNIEDDFSWEDFF